jgi:hypothetical protein
MCAQKPEKTSSSWKTVKVTMWFDGFDALFSYLRILFYNLYFPAVDHFGHPLSVITLLPFCAS